MKSNSKNNIFDFMIFVVAYGISLGINIIVGLNDISFGNITAYCLFFWILESLSLFIPNTYIKIILFFINVYLSYNLAGYYILIKSRSGLDYGFIFKISLAIYCLLAILSLILSLIGFLIIILRKKIKKHK